jgi:hypothetical protein
VGYDRHDRITLAAFHTSAGGADVLLTRMAEAAFDADPLMNINRWRTIVGLPKVADAGGEKSRPVTIGGDPGTLYDYSGPITSSGSMRLLVGFVRHGGSTWFFKLQGPAPAVQQQEEAFRAFLGSVQFAG